MELEEVGKELSEAELEKKDFYETIEKLENKEFLEEVLRSDKWRVLRDVWAQTRTWAQNELNGCDPKDTNKIIRLQVIIDFYDNVLPRSIANYRALGTDALKIAKENGWAGRIAKIFTKD